MAQQGKCNRCMIRWVFDKETKKPLRYLHCPRCHTVLKATSRLSTLQVRNAKFKGGSLEEELPFADK